MSQMIQMSYGYIFFLTIYHIVIENDELLRIMLEGQIQWKKIYGRPRTMFLDMLLKMGEGNISK